MKTHFSLVLVLLLAISPVFAQTYTSYRVGSHQNLAVSPLGGVTLMGGGIEQDDAMAWFLSRANGGDVVVLRYTGGDGYNNYFYSQLGVSLNSVETIVFHSDAAANNAYVLGRLAEADAIWITGGDQWDYVRGWRNSPVATTINQRIAAGAAIGGTSAGMAIQGGMYYTAENSSVTSRNALRNPYNNDMTLSNQAFLNTPWLSNVITDTHYDNPAREGRHVAFMARAYTDWTSNVKGIACDEHTAICIQPNGLARVYGDLPNHNDYAYFIQPNCELSNPGPEDCRPGRRLDWYRGREALKVYRINGTSTGSRWFDLYDWESGSGGDWEEWYVDRGRWRYRNGSAPNCGNRQSGTANYTSYFTGDTANVNVTPTGGVTLMGGASENDDAMVWFLNRADGGDVLVLRYSGSDGYNNYLYSQLGVTVNSVETIVFDNDQAANDPYVLRRISEADAIWFAGGDQWDYVRGWRGNAVTSTINARMAAGVPVGGTSAGMAVLGGIYFSAENGTITSAAALANPFATNAAIDTTAFFDAPYLGNVITDTHYDNPTREGRHTAFLARIYAEGNPNVRGIACDEYTAVCVAPDGKAYVFGEAPNYNDFAYFIRPNCELADPSPENCVAGQALTWDRNGTAVKAYVINGEATGSQFLDLNDWETGNGGTWEDWSVVNGTFSRTPSANPLSCTPTALDDQLNAAVTLFPNPAHHTTQLKVPAEREIERVRLLDGLGKEVRVEMERNAEGVQFNLEHITAGWYLVELEMEGKRLVKKLVVE